jgi:ketosteroid isomerase-like protein
MRGTLLFILSMLTIAPIASSATAPATNAAAKVRAEVQTFVKAYIEAGNKADITALMEMFSRESGVTSIGDGEISRGWDAIRAENDQAVGKEGSYKISVGSIDVMPLGAGYALAVAPYTLTVATAQGDVQLPSAMTMVLEKSGSKWVIVHEHMSTKAAEPTDHQE